jgi:diguanylate cyclase (GGDEF)-like protein
MNFGGFFSRVPQPVLLLIGAILIGAVWLLDLLTGHDISFSIFYLLPIVLVTWYGTRDAGMIYAALAAAAWLLADLWAGHAYRHHFIPYWNAAVRLGFFLIIAGTLAKLRAALDEEQRLARVDFLTGLPNLKAFTDLAEMEILRAGRYNHPLTLAYLDLDNFKAVNDRHGHQTGNLLRRTVADAIKDTVRATDLTARFGGDEFLVLLPDTAAGQAAEIVGRVRERLDGEMKSRGWPVTFSIGVATFISPPASVDVLIQAADRLMYQVKEQGMDCIRCRTV